MTVRERNISVSIDPVKLDRLAEVAIKVGLNLPAGQDLLFGRDPLGRSREAPRRR